MVADGRHDGLFELHLGVQLNRDNTSQLINVLAVEGISEIVIYGSRPAIKCLVSRNKDGTPKAYKEIKKISRSFTKALLDWAEGLSAEKIFAVTVQPKAEMDVDKAMAVHSDTQEGDLISRR